MNYRPEGWDEIIAAIRSELINEPFFLHAPSVNVIETVGNKYADAMLEALRKTGKYNYSGYGTTDFPHARKGYFVFIPDDKEG
jgi:hypothetical protein